MPQANTKIQYMGIKENCAGCYLPFFRLLLLLKQLILDYMSSIFQS